MWTARGRSTLQTLVWCALSACSCQALAQERPPSGAELHSMYCVEVLRAQVTLQQHMIAASSQAAGMAEPQARAQWIDTSAELLQQLAKLEGALHRLQLYMLPRIPALDARALASAIRQGSADAQDPHAAEVCRDLTPL